MNNFNFKLINKLLNRKNNVNTNKMDTFNTYIRDYSIGINYENDWKNNEKYYYFRKEWIKNHIIKLIDIFCKNMDKLDNLQKNSINHVYGYMFFHLDYLMDIKQNEDGSYGIIIDKFGDREFDKKIVEFKKILNILSKDDMEDTEDIFVKDYEKKINKRKNISELYNLMSYVIPIEKLAKFPEFVKLNSYDISENSSLNLEYVLEHPDFKWNLQSFLYHPNFTPESILEVIQLFNFNEHDLKVFELNPNLTLNMVLKYPMLNLDWYRFLNHSKKIKKDELMYILTHKNNIEQLNEYGKNIYYFILENENFPIMDLVHNNMIKKIMDMILNNKKMKLYQFLEKKKNITMEDYQILKDMYPEENIYSCINQNLTYEFLEEKWDKNWIHLHKLMNSEFGLERQRYIQTKLNEYITLKNKLSLKFDKYLLKEIFDYCY